MENNKISTKMPYPSKYVEILGSKMHYLEAGTGDAILFLHGIPTSCYVWRNIIPHLAVLGRCIAPDLIGFGKSDKPSIGYTLYDHIKYIDKLIETLNLKNITLVMHGWGSVIGLDYAMRHEKNCKGLVFYEAFIRAFDGTDISLPFQEQLIALQDLESAGDIVMSGVSFIDKMIPQNIMRELTQEEMENYRQPFVQEGSAKPILQYIKELPKGDGKSEIDKLIAGNASKLMQSDLPKLLLYAIPGFITTIATVMWAKEYLQNIEVSDIGEELHLAQETYPELIGETISVWLQAIEQG